MTSTPSGNNLTSPKCKRIEKYCEDFSLCINIGQKDYVIAEHPSQRYTVFYYGVYGSGKLGRVFESDYLFLESKYDDIADVHDYVNSKVLFEATEDFYLIGFNTLDKNVKWGAKVLTSKDKKITLDSNKGKSFLVCLNGNCLINDKTFKRCNYTEIFHNVEYVLDIEDKGAIGLFSKKIDL
jgi:hypothetical protein